ncbi:hypothetical protein ACFLUH_00200 [Chloroflexota bacterium]
MKFSKKALMLLGVGILVVAFASLGLTYLRQANELVQLDEELFLAEEQLNSIEIKSLSSEEEALDKRLSQLNAQLQSNPDKVELSQLVLSTDTTDTLFDIAELCGVEIYTINSAGLGNSELIDLTCSALPVTITALGDVSNLITYVTRLNDDFTNGTVQQVLIQVPPPPSADTEDEEEDEDLDWFQDEIPGYDIPLPNQPVDEDLPEEPRADIQMIVYVYEDGQ